MLQANKLSRLVKVTIIGNMLHPDWTGHKYFCKATPLPLFSAGILQ
jgi:hypothetical protein